MAIDLEKYKLATPPITGTGGVDLSKYKITPEKKGFVAGIKEDLAARGDKLDTVVEETSAGKQSFASGLLQFLGQGAGFAGDITTRGITQIGRAGIGAAKFFTPKPVEEKVGEALKSAGKGFLESEVGKAGLAALQAGTEAYGSWKQKNPVEARNLEAIANIAVIAPIGRTAKVGAEAALPKIGKGAGLAATSLEASVERKALQEAIEITKPKLTIKEKSAAIQAGRGTTEGITRFPTLTASKRDVEVAKSVQGIVKKQSFDKNVKAIKAEMGNLSTGVRAELRAHPAPSNNAQVRSALRTAKEDSRVIFGKDPALESQYDAVVDEFIRILNSTDKAGKRKYKNTNEGLWDARQEFDDVIERKFPNIFSGKESDVVRRNALLDVRRSVNDYIAESLPEGNQFKPTLKRINNMYTAIENIGDNAARRIDKNLINRVADAIKKHPVASTFVGGTGLGLAISGSAFSALSAVASNPAVLAAILGGAATFKIGKTIYTSKTVRRELADTLKAIDRAAGKAAPEKIGELQADRAAIAALILAMDEAAEGAKQQTSLPDSEKKKTKLRSVTQ